MKECTWTRGYAKGGKSRNIVRGFKLDLDGKGTQGQEKGTSVLKDLIRACVVHSSARVFIHSRLSPPSLSLILSTPFFIL